MEDKLTTMIVNETGRDLVVKVGNRNCFVPLAVVKKRRQHAMELCMNWTYQEFLVEEKNLTNVVGRRLFVNSDDCCDYERITVKESDLGEFVADRVPRKHVFDGRGAGSSSNSADQQSVTRQALGNVLTWLKSWLW